MNTEKKTGRPAVPDHLKKVKRSVYITPEVLELLEQTNQLMGGTSLGDAIELHVMANTKRNEKRGGANDE